MNNGGALPTEINLKQVLLQSLKSNRGFIQRKGMDETHGRDSSCTLPDYAQTATEIEKLCGKE